MNRRGLLKWFGAGGAALAASKVAAGGPSPGSPGQFVNAAYAGGIDRASKAYWDTDKATGEVDWDLSPDGLFHKALSQFRETREPEWRVEERLSRLHSTSPAFRRARLRLREREENTIIAQLQEQFFGKSH